jgi:hypothetical protein
MYLPSECIYFLRASPAVLSMWPCEYFSHPSLVMYSFATPPIKLKLGQQSDGGLLITNHLDQSLWWANQKHWEALGSYLLHSFAQVHSAAEPCTSHGNLRNYAKAKPFSWIKPAYVRFSSSICTVQDHILSTAEDTIRASPPTLRMWRCKNMSHIQVLDTNFFPTPPIKVKLAIIKFDLAIWECSHPWAVPMGKGYGELNMQRSWGVEKKEGSYQCCLSKFKCINICSVKLSVKSFHLQTL